MQIKPIRKGDSTTIQVEDFDDSANNRVISSGNGWALTFYIKGNNNNFSKVADSDWLISISAIESDTLEAGFAAYSLTASKDLEKVTFDSGSLEILENLITADGSFEHRSQSKQDLEAVQAAIRALISGGAVKEYSIAGRSLKKFEMSDLVALESRLILRVKQENAAQNLKDGKPNGRVSYVRFK